MFFDSKGSSMASIAICSCIDREPARKAFQDVGWAEQPFKPVLGTTCYGWQNDNCEFGTIHSYCPVGLVLVGILKSNSDFVLEAEAVVSGLVGVGYFIPLATEIPQTARSAFKHQRKQKVIKG